jgi:RHS repeat-associated protein
MSIGHQETTISVNTFYTGAVAPLPGVKVYLFTEAGSYLNLNSTTDAQGQVKFNLPDKNYKVRVDYLGGQYWSEVFQWQDEEVVIDEGMVDLHVTWNGEEVSGAPVYLFTETGSYLNRNVSTDAQGHAQFTVPVKGYKFRIDYNGHQYWTSVITPIAHQPLSVEVPLEQLALIPTNDPKPSRYDGEAPVYVGEPIKVASLGSLIGLLTQTTVAQVAQPKVYYYLTDHLGTPQKVTDAAGVVVWSGDYKPFGEVASSVSTVQNHFRFPGQYYDTETAMHYNYHRYYQQKTGRYVTPDPIGVPAGPNLFEYAESDPVSKYDPFGLWPTWIHNKMIRAAFSSLPPYLQREIERGSRYADEFQDPRFSYMHAMRQKGQNVELARKLMDAYISDRMKAYECEVARGNLNEAYFVLGMALHPIMDSTSPTHEGFQWWDNFFAMPGYYPAYHWMTEQWHLTAEISQTVDLMMGTLQRYGITTISTH